MLVMGARLSSGTQSEPLHSHGRGTLQLVRQQHAAVRAGTTMMEMDEEVQDNLRSVAFGVRSIAVSSLNEAHGKPYQLVLYDVALLEGNDVVICMEVTPEVSGYQVPVGIAQEIRSDRFSARRWKGVAAVD